MILLYNNRGILIPVFIIVPFLGVTLLYSFLKDNVGVFFSSEASFQFSMGIGFLLSFIWTYHTSYDYVINDGKKVRIEMYNHFFFISNRLWSYIMLGAGVLTLISGVLEFFYG